MKNRTKFYEILVKARTDEVSMILVIGKIMPLIDKYSLNEKNVIDQDLKSILIEYAISVVKEENFVLFFIISLHIFFQIIYCS